MSQSPSFPDQEDNLSQIHHSSRGVQHSLRQFGFQLINSQMEGVKDYLCTDLPENIGGRAKGLIQFGEDWRVFFFIISSKLQSLAALLLFSEYDILRKKVA